MTRRSVHLPAQLLTQLAALAKAEGISVGELIRRVLSVYVGARR